MKYTFASKTSTRSGAIEYSIRKVQENQVGLKSNGTYQLLVYAGHVYLLGDNINTIQKKSRNLN
jgi:hypothetical protein